MFRTISLPIFIGVLAAPSVAVAIPTMPASSTGSPESRAAPVVQLPKSMTRAEFLTRVRARFEAIDTNHDGFLEDTELAAAQQMELKQLDGIRQQRLEQEFNRLDSNHDGQLSKAEFLAAAGPLKPRESAQDIVRQLDKHKLGKVSFADYSAAPVANFDKRAHNGVITPAPGQSGKAAKPITRAEFLRNLRARFDAVDTNHDGYLEESEIATAQQKELQQVDAVRQQRLEQEFSRLDGNHDGELSKAEFMAAAPPARPSETAAQLLGHLDSNKDGKVSLEEYEVGPLTTFNRLDVNHDGTVTPQEIEAARRSAARTDAKK